jgi:hypothetical protein
MRRNRRWKYATIALAGLLAIAVASPAIGGPSLKTLVKKEVSKQISKATGPQGPSGPQGAPGQTGPAGPPMRAIALVDAEVSPVFAPDIPEIGFESITRAETGILCIVPSAGIDPSSDPPLITLEYNLSSGENFTAMWDIETGACDNGEYEIHTYDADTGNPVDDAAFVIRVP